MFTTLSITLINDAVTWTVAFNTDSDILRSMPLSSIEIHILRFWRSNSYWCYGLSCSLSYLHLQQLWIFLSIYHRWRRFTGLVYLGMPLFVTTVCRTVTHNTGEEKMVISSVVYCTVSKCILLHWGESFLLDCVPLSNNCSLIYLLVLFLCKSCVFS